MGYVTSGYPSKSHKRLRPINQKVYYENSKGCKETTLNSSLGKRPRMEPKRLTLNNLPLDIIQRIFVYSGENNSLPLLNRFFYMCLRPNGFLLDLYIRENFFCDLNELLPENDKVYMLDSSVFGNSTLLKYLNSNWSLLDYVHYVVERESIEILQKERRDLYDKGELSDTRKSQVEVVLGAETGKPVQDFPQAFYSFPALFFHNDILEKPPIYNQFLLKMHSYYSIQQAPWLCETVVQWFFWENNDQFDINHLFYAINLILHVSHLPSHTLDTADVLVNLIVCLYLDKPPGLCKLLLCEGLEDERLLLKRKSKIVGKFVRKFYREKPVVLSHDNLWTLLHQIREPSLVEVITQYGGTPSFTVLR